MDFLKYTSHGKHAGEQVKKSEKYFPVYFFTFYTGVERNT